MPNFVAIGQTVELVGNHQNYNTPRSLARSVINHAVCWVTEGKPDPPRNLSITGCTESTVGLKWEPPELDGGSPITGYVVEMRPTSKKTWTKVDDTKTLELTASKLSEGTEYSFRVAAQNAVGVGEFVELEKGVTPKGQFGKFI